MSPPSSSDRPQKKKAERERRETEQDYRSFEALSHLFAAILCPMFRRIKGYAEGSWLAYMYATILKQTRSIVGDSTIENSHVSRASEEERSKKSTHESILRQ